MSSEVLPENLDSLNLSGAYDCVIEMRRPTRFLQSRDVRRSKSPIASWRPRHDMQMEVRNLLTATDTIVLIEKDTVRGVCRNERFGESLRSSHYGGLLGFGEVD
jgi:hypothetical protein